VYFLILVGGVVRATGSGMGCPDWPTCFGSWVPPTSVDQLPEDYKNQYAAYRDKKNQRFASFLTSLGMQETADRILNDPSVLKEEDFNAKKTWVEYVNRLVGVAIGLLIIALFATALPLRQSYPGLYWMALALLVLVLIQGWFGSIVVSTNLTPWTVTVHMFLAIVMVIMLVWMLERSGQGTVALPVSARPWLVAGLVGFVAQIFLGTNVRAALDRLAAAAVDRGSWIANAGLDFVIHRSFSWILVLAQVGIYLKLRKTGVEKSSHLVSILLILCSLLTGTAMAYFSVPALMQPIHLLVAVVAVGWLYQLYLQTRPQAVNL
jgi:cytochrome c oxidase assembly protein subunit 15